MKWISVNDKMPENDGNGFSRTVLVYSKDYHLPTIAFYDYDEAHWIEYNTDEGIVFDVTHWMPLPPEPEVDDADAKSNSIYVTAQPETWGI
jgi:hypothetical protein